MSPRHVKIAPPKGKRVRLDPSKAERVKLAMASPVARSSRGSRRSRGSAKTRFIRVKLDFVVRVDEEMNSVPSFVSPAIITTLIGNGLSAVLPPAMSVDIMPGARMSTNLDFRPQSNPTCCHGTKGCSGQGEKHWCGA
jgi:hypothetical protein